ncbi:MAG: hypothetical protein OIF56_15090 [Cohaesibacter sp.]|nr:hypothetical protein [Cohaesibacter sp.]
MALMGLSACGSEEVKRVEIMAKDVNLREVEDSSAGGQKRARVYIQEKELSPNTAEDRAYVAAMFAYELAAEIRYDYVDVFLVAAGAKSNRQNIIVAKAAYAPEPSKIPFMDVKWKISASGQELTKMQIVVANAWEDNRGQYLDKYGVLDEDKFVPALAKKLGLSEHDIDLPWVSLDQNFDFQLYQMSDLNKKQLDHMVMFVCRTGDC